LRNIVFERSSVRGSKVGDQQAVTVEAAILEAADIYCRPTPADLGVAGLARILDLQDSEAVTFTVAKLAAVKVTVIISMCADAVGPLVRRRTSCLEQSLLRSRARAHHRPMK